MYQLYYNANFAHVCLIGHKVMFIVTVQLIDDMFSHFSAERICKICKMMKNLPTRTFPAGLSMPTERRIVAPSFVICMFSE